MTTEKGQTKEIRDESHTLIILNYNGHQINSKMISKSFFTEKSHRKFCTENPVYFPSLTPSLTLTPSLLSESTFSISAHYIRYYSESHTES